MKTKETVHRSVLPICHGPLVIWKYGTDFFVRRTDSGIYDVTDETAFRIPGKTDCLKRSHHRELFY